MINPSADGHSPAEGVILKGRNRNIPANLIEEKELQSLYENYPNTDYISKRNKVITGTVYIPSNHKRRNRKTKTGTSLIKQSKDHYTTNKEKQSKNYPFKCNPNQRHNRIPSNHKTGTDEAT
jgi:hypothetical protein